MQGSYSCSAKISCACVPPRLCFFHVRYFMLLKKIMIPAFLSASLLGNLTLAHAGNVSQDCSRMNGQITVRGYGNAKALPDEALLDLSAAALHKDLKEARSACEKKTAAFLKAVSSLGIKDEAVQSGSINVSPRYTYDHKSATRKFEGYWAVRDLKIRTDNFSLLGALTSAAVNAGIDEIHGISYALKDESALKKLADERAVADAREQAKRLAEGFEVKLLKPCKLSFENRSQGRSPVMYAAKAATLNADPAEVEEASYLPEESEVESYVNAEYAFE